MKKIVSILIIVLYSLGMGYAQDKKVIDGIGFLRLGMTEKELREAAKIENKKQKRIGQNLKDTNKALFENSGVWKKRRFRTDLVVSKSQGKEKVITIDEYTPIDGEYYFDNISLFFFNDTLYTIWSTSTNIEDIFSFKYGEPLKNEDVQKVNVNIDPSTGDRKPYNTGVTKEVEDIVKVYEWETSNKDIRCIYYMEHKQSSGHFARNFIIENEASRKRLEELKEQQNRKNEKKEQSQLLKSLEDL